MHKRLLNEARLTLTIKPQGPLLIKASDTGADPTRPDMEFVRTWYNGQRVVYLPGSSLKGMLRSHCERIARTIAESLSCNPVVKNKSCVDLRKLEQKHAGDYVHRSSCFICQMFGNTVLAGRLRTADAYPVDVDAIRTEERNGVAIDRVYGSVAVGPFQMEVLTAGEFQTTLAIRNFTIAQMGLLALALRDIKLERVGVGFGKSRGLGHVTATFDRLELYYTRPPEATVHLPGVAFLLGEVEAKAYGYQKDNGASFGYARVAQDVAELPAGMALRDDGWGAWGLELTDETAIEAVWRACIPAWKAAAGID